MSDQDLRQFLETIERLRREHAADPSKARAMLVEEGIVDENGDLAEPYRSQVAVHRLSPSFILGYHGCQRSVGEKLLAGELFELSGNDYDWLGPGIYFWESNPKRALEWAAHIHHRKQLFQPSDPFVVGAIIDLGFCLDLLTSNGSAAVDAAHTSFVEEIRSSGTTSPQNTVGDDLLLRRLDCAVIRHLHGILAAGHQPPVDTVRGVFIEGAPIYPTSGFREKTHLQICVCDPSVIKGIFRVSAKDLE